MIIFSTASIVSAASPPDASTLSAADNHVRRANHLAVSTAPVHVELTSSQRRLSALASAGALYSPATEGQRHTGDMAQSRHKRFVPPLLATDDITAHVIDEVSAAIADNTIGNQLLDDVAAGETASFSRAAVRSGALGGVIAGHDAGMATGALHGSDSGAREGALAGATRGATAGSITGGANGVLGGILMSDGEPEAAVWGEMAGTAAGRMAGRTMGHIIGATTGREAGAASGATQGAAAGGIAGQKAGILAGRMVSDLVTDDLLQHLPFEDQDDMVQIWRIAEQHEHAATVVSRETAARAAHEVGNIAGHRAGALAGYRSGQEIGGREGELAGARAGSEAGYLAGIRAGDVIGRLARHPRSQMQISQSVDALLLHHPQRG